MKIRADIDIQTDALADISRRYQVREIAVFGSVLRDDFREDSDIDVLVDFEPEARIGFFELFDLQEELERLLGRKIDLVSKHGLNRVIRDHVLETSLVVYAAGQAVPG